MQKVNRIFGVIVLLLSQIWVYAQLSSSDSLAYEIAKSKFQIDTSLTGFKLSSIFQNNFLYTPNGNSDLHSDIETSGFGIVTLPDMTFIKGIEFIHRMEASYQEEGSTIKNLQRKDTVINGNKIYESTFEIVNKKTNKVEFIYQAFLKTESAAIAFMGKDIDNGKFFTKFKETFRNIRL